MHKKIYLDNNATTPIDPAVSQAIFQELLKSPANPSSVHSYGREAKERLSCARRAIAQFFQLEEREVLFTSSGTEGINCFLRSLPSKGHILTSNVEHPALNQTLLLLKERGFAITFLPAGLWGAVQLSAIKEHIRTDTCLIALAAVNAETGTKIDWEGIAHFAYSARIPFLLDGVSLLGKEPFSLPLGVTAAVFSAHKFHGPPGTGFMITRSSFPLKPLLLGGHQEFSLRAGTENLPGIVGLARAIELLEQVSLWSEQMFSLRVRLEEGLKAQLPQIEINGQAPRISNTVNICFPEVDGESLFILLDQAGIAVSLGSACSAGSLEPSRILLNMGLSPQKARSSLRFSLSRLTQLEEIDRCIEKVVSLVKQLS